MRSAHSKALLSQHDGRAIESQACRRAGAEVNQYLGQNKMCKPTVQTEALYTAYDSQTAGAMDDKSKAGDGI